MTGAGALPVPVSRSRGSPHPNRNKTFNINYLQLPAPKQQHDASGRGFKDFTRVKIHNPSPGMKAAGDSRRKPA